MAINTTSQRSIDARRASAVNLGMGRRGSRFMPMNEFEKRAVGTCSDFYVRNQFLNPSSVVTL